MRLTKDWPGLMWAILCVALVLRVWGTWYGLPFVYHKDEYHEVMRAMELGAGGFNFERTGKGGLYLLLFVEYGAYYVFLKAMGFIESTRDFAELFARDPSVFYLLGRLTAAMFGVATVVVCYWITKRAYSATAGILAALILTVNALHVDLSRVVGVDIPMTMLAALALLFALRVAEGHSRRDYLIAALFGGLATTTKLPGILIVVPLLVAHTYAIRGRENPVQRWFAARELWASAALFVVVLIATNPGIVAVSNPLALYANPFAEDIELDTDSTEMASGVRPNLFLYYFLTLADSMGWPLLIVCLVGVGIAFKRRTPSDVILLSYLMINYIAISSTTSSKLFYPRYLLPILLVLSVLGARVMAQTIAAYSNRRMALGAGALALMVTPLWHTVVDAYTVTQLDSRTLALRWIEANIPETSVVLIEGGKVGPDRGTVPLLESEEAMRARVEFWKKREPRQAKYLEIELSIHPGGGFTLEFVRLGEMKTVTQYLKDGVQYFVVRPNYFFRSRKSNQASADFIRDLRDRPDVELLRRFEGDSDLQNGPTIEVYGLRPDVKQNLRKPLERVNQN